MSKTSILGLPPELIFRIFMEFGPREMFAITKINPLFSDLARAFGKQHPQAQSIKYSWNKDWALTQDQIITSVLEGIIEYFEYKETKQYDIDQIEDFTTTRPEGFWENYNGFH